MNGIINILKPPGMTSHDIINVLRKMLGIKKIGHGGTLDPMAAGVLPIFIAKGTKVAEYYQSDDKEYIAEMTLGIVTDTGDITGNIIENNSVNVKISQLQDVLEEFKGKIQQIPPMYSAIHYKGKKLYELARKGISVTREPRTVEIKSLKMLYFQENKVFLRVTCSKGTYIRTLCEDIGKKLKCGACLSCLVRTRSGMFYINNSYTLEEVEYILKNDDFEKILLPLDYGLTSLPKIDLCESDLRLFSKGKVFNIKCNSPDESLIGVYYNNKIIGIGINDTQKSAIKIVKSFI